MSKALEAAEVVAWRSTSTGALFLPHHGDPSEDEGLVTLASFRAMQARAEAAEEALRVSELEGDAAFALAVDDPGKNPPVTWKSRAEAAEARVKELEGALGFYAKTENYKGEFVSGGLTDHGTYAMAHNVNAVRKDAGEIARTALKGGSNG